MCSLGLMMCFLERRPPSSLVQRATGVNCPRRCPTTSQAEALQLRMSPRPWLSKRGAALHGTIGCARPTCCAALSQTVPALSPLRPPCPIFQDGANAPECGERRPRDTRARVLPKSRPTSPRRVTGTHSTLCGTVVSARINSLGAPSPQPLGPSSLGSGSGASRTR